MEFSHRNFIDALRYNWSKEDRWIDGESLALSAQSFGNGAEY